MGAEGDEGGGGGGKSRTAPGPGDTPPPPRLSCGGTRPAGPAYCPPPNFEAAPAPSHGPALLLLLIRSSCRSLHRLRCHPSIESFRVRHRAALRPGAQAIPPSRGCIDVECPCPRRLFPPGKHGGRRHRDSSRNQESGRGFSSWWCSPTAGRRRTALAPAA